MHLHLIAPFHTEVTQEYSHCAFTGLTHRFPKMVSLSGHLTTLYSNGENESEAEHHARILSRDELDALVPKNLSTEHRHTARTDSEHYRLFHERLRVALRERVQYGDIICHPFGNAHASLVSEIPQAFHLETGVGYDCDNFGAHRIFGSHAWRHYILGKYQREASDFEWAIHHYYDGEDWTVRPRHGTYLLYLGRAMASKGMAHLKTVAALSGRKVLVVGQQEPGVTQAFAHENLIFLPPVQGKERDELLGKALAVLMPTRYVEPFGGVAAEAQMCGTPVIASAFGGMTESVEHGVTGFHVHSAGDMLAAIDQVSDLDRLEISQLARRRFGLASRSKEYNKVFGLISEIPHDGWYTKRGFL
jgi:glycosyltransferase involved in cell wall biosynthesis